MGLPIGIGILGFVVVPLFLWFMGSLSVKRRPVAARIFAFVAGGDNRLSLSRLQAFAWTLVIFGSFAAAMISHTVIAATGEAETKRRQAAAKVTLDAAEAALKLIDARLIQLQKLLADNKMAQAAADVSVSVSKAALAAASGLEREAIQKKANEDQKTSADLAVQRGALESAIGSALGERVAGERSRAAAENLINATSTDWVKIPPELLALAGIAIASGVVSSLISAFNDEAKSACVTKLLVTSGQELKQRFAEANAQATSTVLVIEGIGFGKSGRVRVNECSAANLYWGHDGTVIATEMPLVENWEMLVVETPHGKLAYDVSGTVALPILGLARFVYDLADLFRDDKTPSTFSLMKFQMFGWTIVAIAIYSVVFLMNLSPQMAELPKVDASIVILTGLSQTGYLAGKAISNVGDK